MKKLSILLLIAIALLSLGACKSAEFAKQVAYFQNADEADLTGSKRPFDAHIMPKDYLQITVHALDPRASDLFNLNVQTTHRHHRHFLREQQHTALPRRQ